jgi:hypothetical protein
LSGATHPVPVVPVVPLVVVDELDELELPVVVLLDERPVVLPDEPLLLLPLLLPLVDVLPVVPPLEPLLVGWGSSPHAARHSAAARPTHAFREILVIISFSPPRCCLRQLPCLIRVRQSFIPRKPRR